MERQAKRWNGLSRHREPEPTLPFGLDADVPADPDPLRPDPEHPTPLELVLRLTRSQREDRVKRLVDMAWERYGDALESIGDSRKDAAAVCALVSGGNDSYTIAHLFRPVTTHTVHANTRTGIEATRQFVRDTSAAWGIPLVEVSPNAGQGYFDFVRGTVLSRDQTTGELVPTWPGGFPGPAGHAFMYQRLKERALRKVPHALGISGSRQEVALFLAGRRRPESTRRASVPHVDPRGTTVWASPLAVWHKADLRAYRLMHADTMPTNPVAERLGLSGECGCLSNAVPGERETWLREYGDDPWVREVLAVEEELADRADIPPWRRRWAWGADYEETAEDLAAFRAHLARLGDDEPALDLGSSSLCSTNCGPDPLWDAMDPLFDLDSSPA